MPTIPHVGSPINWRFLKVGLILENGSMFQYYEVLIVILIGFTSAAISEVISYFIVYRKHEWKQLKKNGDDLYEKYEHLTSIKLTAPAFRAKLDSIRSQIKANQTRMSRMRMLPSLLLTVVLFGVMFFVRRYFKGHVVARLPFVPLALVARITHRGIDGDDMSEVSMFAVYSLTSMVFRAVLQRAGGHVPPKAPPMVEPPMDDAE